jgi:hypothetical protein
MALQALSVSLDGTDGKLKKKKKIRYRQPTQSADATIIV